MFTEGDATAQESFARVHGSWVYLPFLPDSWGGILAVGKARDHMAVGPPGTSQDEPDLQTWVCAEAEGGEDG